MLRAWSWCEGFPHHRYIDRVILAAVFVLATAPCVQAGDEEGEDSRR
jgi:hypothetical protein